MKKNEMYKKFSGVVTRLTFNESSICQSNEIELVALCIWNRLFDMNNENIYKFRPLEQDFKAFKVPLHINSNNFDDKQFSKVLNAVKESYDKFLLDIESNLYFFKLSNELDLDYYYLERYYEDGFYHTFFRILDKKED